MGVRDSYQCCRASNLVQPGKTFNTDDYVSTAMVVWLLAFGGIDFGEAMRLTLSFEKKRRVGGDGDTSICT